MTTSRSIPQPRTDQEAEQLAAWHLPSLRLDPGWQLAIYLLVTMRIGLELFGFLSTRLLNTNVIGGEHINLLITNGQPWSQLLSLWQRWDALWYQYIAENGYHAGDGSVHFQPLYSLLSAAVSLVLGGAIVLAELVVASAAFVLAAWLLYQLARMDVSDRTAQLTVVLLVLFPTGFFLFAPYTESLFLLTTVATFWFARRNQPWLAGLAGMCAVLTRMFGVFLVLPLAFEYLRQRHDRREPIGPALFACTLPAAALILLNLYDQLIVKETESPFQLAKHWGQNIVGPFDPLPAAFQHVAQTGDAIEVINIVFLLGITALALYGLRRLTLTYWLYVFPYLLLLFSEHGLLSPLESANRYVLPLFPCFIVLASKLVRYPWLAATFIGVSLMVQLFLFDYWVHFGFVA